MRMKRQGKSDERPDVITKRSKKRREDQTRIERKEESVRDPLANGHSVKRYARFVSHNPAQFLGWRPLSLLAGLSSIIFGQLASESPEGKQNAAVS